jgi:hypothetical protein
MYEVWLVTIIRNDLPKQEIYQFFGAEFTLEELMEFYGLVGHQFLDSEGVLHCLEVDGYVRVNQNNMRVEEYIGSHFMFCKANYPVGMEGL